MTDKQPSISFTDEVNQIGTPKQGQLQIDFRDLQRRGLWDGRHIWSIHMLYFILDPDQEVDDVVCGPENFLAYGGISCLKCRRIYFRMGDDALPCNPPDIV